MLPLAVQLILVFLVIALEDGLLVLVHRGFGVVLPLIEVAGQITGTHFLVTVTTGVHRGITNLLGPKPAFLIQKMGLYRV